jgi:hypothetical protein
VPPRGYWARKALGKEDPIPPLPVSHSGREVIAISKWQAPAGGVGVPQQVQSLLDGEQRARPIPVNPHRRLKHRGVLHARDVLKAATPDERGIVRTPRHLELLDIRVAPASTRRALAIVDTWLDACLARGYPVEANRERRPRAQALDTWFSLRVYERANRVPAPTPTQLARAKRARPWRTDLQVFEPTGRLDMVLTEQTWDIHEWHETQSRRVEDQLHEVIAEMLRHGQYRRDQEAEHARAHERAALVSRLQRYIDSRVTQLNRAAQQYQEFVALSALVDALAQSAHGRSLEPPVRLVALGRVAESGARAAAHAGEAGFGRNQRAATPTPCDGLADGSHTWRTGTPRPPFCRTTQPRHQVG